jgi:hypothetical protein
MARCALAADRPGRRGWARAAHRLFRSQRSTWWQAHTARARQARYRAGPASPRCSAGEPGRRRLDHLDASDAAQAHLLAGRIALTSGAATAGAT